MAHTHDHDHDTYYLDQMCLIALSAAFGGICLALYFSAQGTQPEGAEPPMLTLLLGPQFHPFILVSGIALLVLAAARAVIVWRSAGSAPAHTHTPNHAHAHDHAHDHEHCHDHDHAHSHEHGHEHCGHEHHVTAEPGHVHAHASAPGHSHAHPHPDHGHGHDHGHDHSWAPWRYVVLLIPVMLFCLGLPNKLPPIEGSGKVDVSTEVSWGVGVLALGPMPLHQAAALAAAHFNPLAQEAPIYLDGKLVALADLQLGTPIALKLMRGPRVVEEGVVEIQAGESAIKLGPGDSSLLVGKVQEVIAGEKLLTVSYAHQGAEKSRTFDLGQGPVYGVDFKTLEAMARSEDRRKEWAGKTVQVVGQFNFRGGDRFFELVRFKMQCCSADAIQVGVPVVLGRGSLSGL
ncbi:MAG: hypothetical protein L0Z62_09575, partial [Gemmataceae bacterium]|nr:hypothetical protein [Gemmataceae bacterium]